jgi:hypothetical protein
MSIRSCSSLSTGGGGALKYRERRNEKVPGEVDTWQDSARFDTIF